MSSISWEEYLIDAVKGFRQLFDKLSTDTQATIKNKGFHDLPLPPSQFEVLDFEQRKRVVILMVHDKHHPDMEIQVPPNPQSFDDSEFIKRYKKTFQLLSSEEIEKIEKQTSSTPLIQFYSKNIVRVTRQTESPKEFSLHFVRTMVRVIRDQQVDVIQRSATEIKKSASKIAESDLRREISNYAENIDNVMGETKRLSKELTSLRKLIGESEDIQDWKLLITDVSRLKQEHVAREIFDAKIGELNSKIDSFKEIKEGYEKMLAQQQEFMKQQAEVMKQQSSFVTWIKYATILVPIAVVLVPIIDALIRHFLGIP